MKRYQKKKSVQKQYVGVCRGDFSWLLKLKLPLWVGGSSFPVDRVKQDHSLYFKTIQVILTPGMGDLQRPCCRLEKGGRSKLYSWTNYCRAAQYGNNQKSSVPV